MNDEGSTIEVTYDLRGSGISYKTAANLAVFPKNTETDVARCAEILGWKLDQKFILKTNPNSNKKGTIKHPFPSPITVREALEYFVDLRGAIMKKTLKDMAEHCSNETDKNRLKALADNKDEFVEEIEKNQSGLLDLLEKYESLRPSMEVFFQIT